MAHIKPGSPEEKADRLTRARARVRVMWRGQTRVGEVIAWIPGLKAVAGFAAVPPIVTVLLDGKGLKSLYRIDDVEVL